MIWHIFCSEVSTVVVNDIYKFACIGGLQRRLENSGNRVQNTFLGNAKGQSALLVEWRKIRWERQQRWQQHSWDNETFPWSVLRDESWHYWEHYREDVWWVWGYGCLLSRKSQSWAIRRGCLFFFFFFSFNEDILCWQSVHAIEVTTTTLRELTLSWSWQVLPFVQCHTYGYCWINDECKGRIYVNRGRATAPGTLSILY